MEEDLSHGINTEKEWKEKRFGFHCKKKDGMDGLAPDEALPSIPPQPLTLNPEN